MIMKADLPSGPSIPGLKERVEEMREKVTERPPPKRRLPIVVGILVIVLVIAGAGFIASYFLYYKPILVETKQFDLEKAKKIELINNVFTGPLADAAEKQELIKDVKVATTSSDLAAVEAKLKIYGLKAWKDQRTKDVLENLDGRVMIEIQQQVGSYTKDEALAYIQSFAMITPLIEMKIGKPDLVSVPIVLGRLNASAGVLHTGDIVDIFVSNKDGVKLLTTGARIVAIFRDKSSGEITLTESERKLQSGGGVEGKGTVETLVIGAATATLTGSFAGSSGVRVGEYESKYTTSVEEVLKAAAADKISRAYVKSVLGGYGWTLGTLERIANIADFNSRYMILIEVPRGQAGDVLANMNSLVLTIPTARAPAWVSSVE